MWLLLETVCWGEDTTTLAAIGGNPLSGQGRRMEMGLGVDNFRKILRVLYLKTVMLINGGQLQTPALHILYVTDLR